MNREFYGKKPYFGAIGLSILCDTFWKTTRERYKKKGVYTNDIHSTLSPVVIIEKQRDHLIPNVFQFLTEKNAYYSSMYTRGKL